MLMINPPDDCDAMTAYADCATKSGPRRFNATMAVLNFGDAVGVSEGGDPPALLTTTSSRPCIATIASTRFDTAEASRTSASINAAEEDTGACRPQMTTEAPASTKRDVIPAPTPRAPPV